MLTPVQGASKFDQSRFAVKWHRPSRAPVPPQCSADPSARPHWPPVLPRPPSLQYIAVRLMDLSSAVSLAFLAPVLTAALSQALLNERPPRSVLAALALAAAGALLVARPSSFAALLPGLGATGAATAAVAVGPSKAGVAAALAHAISAAGAKLAVRSLAAGSAHRSVGGAIVLSAGVVSAVGSGAVVLVQRSFVAPSTPSHWLLLAAVGLVGWLHQSTMTAGLSRVPVSTASSLT